MGLCEPRANGCEKRLGNSARANPAAPLGTRARTRRAGPANLASPSRSAPSRRHSPQAAYIARRGVEDVLHRHLDDDRPRRGRESGEKDRQVLQQLLLGRIAHGGFHRMVPSYASQGDSTRVATVRFAGRSRRRSVDFRWMSPNAARVNGCLTNGAGHLTQRRARQGPRCVTSIRLPSRRMRSAGSSA